MDNHKVTINKAPILYDFIFSFRYRLVLGQSLCQRLKLIAMFHGNVSIVQTHAAKAFAQAGRASKRSA